MHCQVVGGFDGVLGVHTREGRRGGRGWWVV